MRTAHACVTIAHIDRYFPSFRRIFCPQTQGLKAPLRCSAANVQIFCTTNYRHQSLVCTILYP